MARKIRSHAYEARNMVKAQCNRNFLDLTAASLYQIGTKYMLHMPTVEHVNECTRVFQMESN